MGIYFGNEIIEYKNLEELLYFNQIWGNLLMKEIQSNFIKIFFILNLIVNYKIKNFTLIWNMECGKGQVLGFTIEALGYLVELETKISLQIQINNLDQCLEDLNFLGLPSKFF